MFFKVSCFLEALHSSGLCLAHISKTSHHQKSTVLPLTFFDVFLAILWFLVAPVGVTALFLTRGARVGGGFTSGGVRRTAISVIFLLLGEFLDLDLESSDLVISWVFLSPLLLLTKGVVDRLSLDHKVLVVDVLVLVSRNGFHVMDCM